MEEYLTAKREAFANHSLANFVRREVPREFSKLSFVNENDYIISTSVSQGNWIMIPLIAI